jgi:uncharacterized membrane protein YkgB
MITCAYIGLSVLISQNVTLLCKNTQLMKENEMSAFSCIFNIAMIILGILGIIGLATM